jgi:hypothetical protein
MVTRQYWVYYATVDDGCLQHKIGVKSDKWGVHFTLLYYYVAEKSEVCRPFSELIGGRLYWNGATHVGVSGDRKKSSSANGFSSGRENPSIYGRWQGK